jgi:hypothetical protein
MLYIFDSHPFCCLDSSVIFLTVPYDVRICASRTPKKRVGFTGLTAPAREGAKIFCAEGKEQVLPNWDRPFSVFMNVIACPATDPILDYCYP